MLEKRDGRKRLSLSLSFIRGCAHAGDVTRLANVGCGTGAARRDAASDERVGVQTFGALRKRKD